MGLPGIAIYFMQVALIVPALIEFGILPNFFIYYFGVFSFITPPVCISAIAAASIAGASPMRTGWEAVKLGVVAFIVPFVFVISRFWDRMAVDFVTARPEACCRERRTERFRRPRLAGVSFSARPRWRCSRR